MEVDVRLTAFFHFGVILDMEMVMVVEKSCYYSVEERIFPFDY